MIIPSEVSLIETHLVGVFPSQVRFCVHLRWLEYSLGEQRASLFFTEWCVLAAFCLKQHNLLFVVGEGVF
jgi:hypothetical protein